MLEEGDGFTRPASREEGIESTGYGNEHHRPSTREQPQSFSVVASLGGFLYPEEYDATKKRNPLQVARRPAGILTRFFFAE